MAVAAALDTPLRADAPTLDFENHTTSPFHENGGFPAGPIGGTLNYYRLDGNWDLSICPSPLCAITTGQQIPMAFVETEDTPRHEGTYALSPGTNLTFTSGPYTSTGLDGSLHFGPGGWLRIYGTMLDGMGLPVAGPTLLLNGRFDEAVYEYRENQVRLFSGKGPDSKNEDLIGYFFDRDALGWNFSAQLVGVANPLMGETLTRGGVPVWDIEVTNIEAPEPASVLLFATVLLVLAAAARRCRA